MTAPERADPVFEPLITERLIIRAPQMADLDAIVARRNDPEVARYQDWTLPHAAEETRTRLEAAIAQAGLVDGQWWGTAVTLRDSGHVIGDLPICIRWGWRAAEVGYSFDSAHWGRGYAAEALDAVLNHLFEDRGVQRVSATLHPENVASAILLERAGFLFEGQTKNSFWLGDGPDAENSDDGLYGLTKPDRESWLNRPTGPVAQVELVDIDYQNQREVRHLVTHKSQERMVAPVAISFANALFPALLNGNPITPKMWAVQADGDLAGFVMIADRTKHHPDPYLWRLLIDRRFQRRGIGSGAVDLVEDYCRTQGARSIYVSWEEGRGSPEPFYVARGYVPTGERPDGEVEACKQL